MKIYLCAAGSEDPVPEGHTPFSWAVQRLRSVGAPPLCNNEGEKGEGKAVRKGFLEKKVQPVTDVGKLLRQRVPEVVAIAEALHRAQEEDESQPFKRKYEARNKLQALKQQLAASETNCVAQGLEWEWGEAMAKLEVLLGVNFAETEEISAGEKALFAAMGEPFPVCVGICLFRGKEVGLKGTD